MGAIRAARNFSCPAQPPTLLKAIAQIDSTSTRRTFISCYEQTPAIDRAALTHAPAIGCQL